MVASRRTMWLYSVRHYVDWHGWASHSVQQHYLRVICQGNKAVAEQRFDIQHYDRLQRYWFANNAMLLFNQGVLAFRARNLPRATEYFRQVQQRATNPSLQVQSHYNLGLVMLALDEAERAAEFFKENAPSRSPEYSSKIQPRASLSFCPQQPLIRERPR